MSSGRGDPEHPDRSRRGRKVLGARPQGRGAPPQPAGDRRQVYPWRGWAGRSAATEVIPDVAGENGVGFLIDTFMAAAAAGEKVDILMIGPLTNLGLALRLVPGIVAGIGQLTIMGGIGLWPRQHHAGSRVQHLCRSRSGADRVRAPLDIVVAPWEPCVTHNMTGAEVDALFAGVPDGSRKSSPWPWRRMHAKPLPAMAAATISLR